MNIDLDRVLDGYTTCALWSSLDDNGEPLDDLYTEDDLAERTEDEFREDCEDFITANRELLLASGLTAEQIGHDFWLTRNRHGSGFWDRGLEDIGERLTDAAHAYGECDLYVGDDGELYV